ncbi:phosphate regulon sensor protein PhoR [alpha proteobacterium U9-1i]|nr:phosphate regulon sensor protein PhoR [alpha proteobacterium U9-1i]
MRAGCTNVCARPNCGQLKTMTTEQSSLRQIASERMAGLAWAGAGIGVLAALVTVWTNPLAALFAAALGASLAWAATRTSASRRFQPVARNDIVIVGLRDLAPLLEALPDSALLIDVEGRVAGSNAAARRELQFEAAGLFLSSILRHPALLDAVQAAYDGATRTVEYDTADQVEQHIRCYVAPVLWGDEKAALIVFHDQTSRVNTERMRADFLANASHELRTPVASLTLLIETLRGHARDNPEEREHFLGMMQVQADRMRRLIDDLLSLSRIELDEHVPPTDRADLNQVAREVTDVMHSTAKERGVTLNTIDATGPARVVGDRFQLSQVVQNLVDNAIKYSPNGGHVNVHVGHAASREDAIQAAGRRWDEAGRIALLTPASAPNRAYVYVRVEDSGPGVARRYLPRLGERFFRVEREEGAERGGTGLGLAIVKHIINRHRGGLIVESQPGKGSAFIAFVEAAAD